MKKRLSGRSPVITGASSGVGRAIARAYASEGANVALIARNVDGLEAAAGEAHAAGAEAMILPLDVADSAAVETTADQVAFEVVRNRREGHPQPVPPIYQPTRSRKHMSQVWVTRHRGLIAAAGLTTAAALLLSRWQS